MKVLAMLTIELPDDATFPDVVSRERVGHVIMLAKRGAEREIAIDQFLGGRVTVGANLVKANHETEAARQEPSPYQQQTEEQP